MIPLLGIYPKEPKTLIWKNTSTPMFIAALFTITNIWKQPKCPTTDEWIKQPWDIYTMEYYWAVKKKKVLPFATVWMDLENIMLSESEIIQSGKHKYHMISLICVIYWTKWTTKQSKDRLIGQDQADNFRGRSGLGALSIKEKKRKKLMDVDNSMEFSGEKSVWWRYRRI